MVNFDQMKSFFPLDRWSVYNNNITWDRPHIHITRAPRRQNVTFENKQCWEIIILHFGFYLFWHSNVDTFTSGMMVVLLIWCIRMMKCSSQFHPHAEYVLHCVRKGNTVFTGLIRRCNRSIFRFRSRKPNKLIVPIRSTNPAYTAVEHSE